MAQQARHDQQIPKSSSIGQGFLGSAKVWVRNGLIKKKKGQEAVWVKVVRAKSGQKKIEKRINKKSLSPSPQTIKCNNKKKEKIPKNQKMKDISLPPFPNQKFQKKQNQQKNQKLEKC